MTSTTADIPNGSKRRRSLPGKALRWIFGLFVVLCLALAVTLWIVTRSWFIIGRLTPEMQRKLGGDVYIGSAKYQGDGQVVFSDLRLRARDVPGPAGEIARIGQAIVTVDLRKLLSGDIGRQ